MIKTIFIVFNIILLNGWDEKGKIKLGGKDKFKLGGQWEGGGREKAKSNFMKDPFKISKRSLHWYM